MSNEIGDEAMNDTGQDPERWLEHISTLKGWLSQECGVMRKLYEQQIADYDDVLEWYGEAEVTTVDDGKRARDVRAKYSQEETK